MSDHFRLEEIDGVTVVTLAGPKLASGASGPLYGLVEQGGPRRLLLNFENVRFLSSNALAILVGLRRRIDAAGGRLRLCCLDPDLLELFRITRLDGIFDIAGSQQEALDTF